MKNIHILPTDKPSRLFIDENILILDNEYLPNIPSDGQNQHIYITSDEEIKEGDWCMSLCDDESYEEIYQCKDIKLVDEEDKKIILTTDQDLIKDGVQAIDDEFLEWFVKNPSCEWVEVDKLLQTRWGTEWHDLPNQREGRELDGIYRNIYKIIIPKEEPEKETMKQTAVESIIKFCEQMANQDLNSHRGAYFNVIKFCKDQAKEMQNQQIGEAYEDGYSDSDNNFELNKEYYNEKFKNK